MLKRAQFYYRNPCSTYEEAKSFLEDHGILVEARDLIKNPLRPNEIRSILRNFDTKHFIDSSSSAFKKAKLDENIPPRDELFDMMIEYPELLRHPIITCGRLMTVGAGRKQLIAMFQISVSDNGSDREEEKVKTRAFKGRK